jgi:UDP-glucose 4-epimerase
MYLSQLPEDYDMLFIGNGCNLHIPNNIIQSNKYIYFKNNIPIDCQLDIKNWNVNWGIGVARCTDSYLISKKCAQKILNYFNNIKVESSINHPIDFWLNNIIKILNLNIYWAEPTIISQGTQCGIFKSSIGH